MALYRDEGVVLRTVKLGEADRIITLMTRNHGKIRAVAKGVRRVKSRFGGRLEPFMRCDLLVAQGRSLDVISQASSISAYASTVCADYESYGAASAMVEVVDKLVSNEDEPAQAQYLLLISALHALELNRHQASSVGYSYALRALALAGWTPRLDSCVVCSTRDDLGYFSSEAGGVMCSVHHTRQSRPIGLEGRELLEALLEGDWSVLDRTVPDQQTCRFVEEWCEYYLERPIRSWQLLHS